MHEGVRKLKLDRFQKIGLKGLAADLMAISELQRLDQPDSPPYDCLITVVLSLSSLADVIKETAETQALEPNGVLYCLYPKKGNQRYASFIPRDDIFQLDVNQAGFFGDTDLKLNTMTAFDDTFTVCGIKRVPSKTYQAPKVSQSVADYADRIEELHPELDETELAALNQLTLGYQKGWARYVLSAVQPATRAKRITEMKLALQAGFKSIEFYKETLKK